MMKGKPKERHIFKRPVLFRPSKAFKTLFCCSSPLYHIPLLVDVLQSLFVSFVQSLGQSCTNNNPSLLTCLHFYAKEED